MNTAMSQMDEQHKNVQLLLPWYLNNSLNQQDSDLVAAHVMRCLVCRRELIGLRKLSEAVNNASDLDTMAETSFANLSAKLPAKTGQLIRQNRSKPSLPTIYSGFTGNKLFRYAIAACLLLGLWPLGLNTLVQPNVAAYQTLSDEKPVLQQTGHLRVVFAPTVSMTNINSVITALHGQQVGKANSLGALTIRLADDSLDLTQALTMLRSRSDVLLAEPISQP